MVKDLTNVYLNNMKIQFNGKYKSLTNFQSEELSKFTVITGKNGSGKSQLIHCIEFAHVGPGQSGFSLTFEPPILKLQVSDLRYNPMGLASMNTVRPKLEKFYNSYTALKQKHIELYSYLIEKKTSINQFVEFDLESIKAFLAVDDIKPLIIGLLQEKAAGGYSGMNENSLLPILKRNLTNDTILFELLFIISIYKGKKLKEIDRNDFFKTPFPEKYVDASDMFNSQIEMIFFSYLKRRHDNDYLNYRNQKHKENNNVIEDEEFEKQFPAPWSIINKILSDNNIDLKVKEYNIKDYSDEFTLDFKFIKEGIDELVSFADLSSGEQVIIGLVVKLFAKHYYEGDFTFPELIVLDEPDANLHPEMSKLLIDVLYKSFVKDLGIKIIITTHSPATVALAPEESIYELNNNPNCYLKKISKDDALNILTGMIPNLSIDYKNHKQIFVESPTDVSYFQKLFNKLYSEEKMNYKLYFISNNKGDGNCTWVREIVAKLREGGVNKSYGIIDWDTTNKSSDSVFVHGEDKRYAIENFVFDPVYLCILFLESKGAHNIRAELGFDETYNQYNLSNESNNRLQQVWDWFLKKIYEKFPALKSENTNTIVYYNRKEVLVPDWFLTTKGHEIEPKLRETFQILAKFTAEGDLQNNLSTIMAKCFPLVPMESIELLKKLCL